MEQQAAGFEYRREERREVRQQEVREFHYEWKVRAEATVEPLPFSHDYFKMHWDRLVNIDIITQEQLRYFVCSVPNCNKLVSPLTVSGE